MGPTPTKHPWLGLIAFVVVCFLAAGIGGMVTAPNIPNWYADLAKPSWNPPNWLFGPVWTALYLGMAVAAWLVWRQGGWAGAARPLGVFGAQLVLNVLWSCLFFGLHRPDLAFVEVLLLWVPSWRRWLSSGGGRNGWGTLRPVPGVGHVRQRPELRRLAAERIAGGGLLHRPIWQGRR